MKKNLFTAALLIALLPLGAAAQKHGIGLHFGAYDFYGPQTDKYFLNDRDEIKLNRDKNTYDTVTRNRLFWSPMARITYWWQVNKHIDVNIGLSVANLEYPEANPDSAYIARTNDVNASRNNMMLAELDFRFNYNFLAKEDWIMSPYIFAGVNGAYHGDYLGADIPLGVGLNFNLNSSHNVFLNLESGYKVAATEHNVNHLQHSAGLVYWFKPGYKPAVESVADLAPEPVIPDTDNDGLLDNEDDCPTIAGAAQFNGCPDSDGDGVSDKDDACPLVAGTVALKGCPDTDGDGIPDNTDKCPYVAGAADREGCPIPDKDGDGFSDDEDRCPELYSKTNAGCPEIRKEVIMQVEKAAKAIFFETGKATIKKASFKSLDAVVAILQSDPSLYVDVEGHTDNVQPKTYTNMDLSQQRAESVRAYLVSKGIADNRITAQGFGETQPVADNATAPGRAQNRRTVLKLRNYTK